MKKKASVRRGSQGLVTRPFSKRVHMMVGVCRSFSGANQQMRWWQLWCCLAACGNGKYLTGPSACPGQA